MRQIVVDNKALQLLDVEELLSAISGYGQKESGHAAQFLEPESREHGLLNERVFKCDW
jgi:hypothetical protein